jgi:hypothetical protein
MYSYSNLRSPFLPVPTQDGNPIQTHYAHNMGILTGLTCHGIRRHPPKHDLQSWTLLRPST